MDEDRILAAITDIGRKITDMQQEVTTMHEEIATMQGDITQIRKEATDFRIVVMSKFEGIEDRLTRMAEDTTVTMMAVQNEAKHRREDRRELADMSEMQMIMQRQLMRLRTDVEEIQKKP